MTNHPKFLKFGTKAIHGGIEPDAATGAIMTPIYQTSTYLQQAPGKHKGFEYARTQQPTRQALEKNLAVLENGKYGICFGSGMAATDAVMRLLQPGDEVVAINDLYGGSYRIFTKIYQKYDIKFHFTPMQDPKAIIPYITDQTRLIWIESPTNPMLNVVDLKAVVKIARKYEIGVCVDNTFASPYLQNPLDLGADLVLHSATKYLGGHSDVVLGGVVCNDSDLAEQLYFVQNTCGGIPGPQDCFLVLRGIKTLHLRVERHCENAAAVAEMLVAHPKVAHVAYPGLTTHPNHAVARRQMRRFGGMVTFSLKGDHKADALKVLQNTKLFLLAESLGGVESLIGHPATMTHAAIPEAERRKTGVSDSLIRLSVGVEDKDDLLEDLKQALDKV